MVGLLIKVIKVLFFCGYVCVYVYVFVFVVGVRVVVVVVLNFWYIVVYISSFSLVSLR